MDIKPRSLTTITVAMPVYNCIEFIEEAIDSVLMQSDQDWNLVISDNASTDGTKALLKRLEGKLDARTSIFYQETNIGIYENLNFLLSVISSDIIHILCSDDAFSSRDSIGIIKSKWPYNSQIGAVRWNGYSNSMIIAPRRFEPKSSQLYFLLHGNLLGNLSNVTFNKKALLESGSFDISYPYVGDFATWARLAQKYEIHICPDIVTSIRRHPGSASNYLNKKGEVHIEQAENIFYIQKRVNSPNKLSRLILSIALSVCYDSPYRLSALLSALRGNRQYLASLNKSNQRKNGFVGRILLWILWLITIGGRLWKRQIIAIAIRAHT
jgi:glycosyltransferase involved in cell wall biosynthesis